MLVVTRFHATEHDFIERARAALDALRAQRGFVRGHVGRAADDPTWWVLVCEWENVGAYRRALSAFEVKLAATPLLGLARDEVSAYEVLIAADKAGVVESVSLRAEDACIEHQDRED